LTPSISTNHIKAGEEVQNEIPMDFILEFFRIILVLSELSSH
jgi:hypothetical protein